MQATPTTWRLLLAAGWQGNDQLKILCGGEALSRELANRLLERGASLWNLYGPTEATIWSAIHQVDKMSESVPIGRPIANTQIYLLDQHLQPVPVGIPGELYIGGAGLARGYLNQPELTAEKFIPNHFSHEPKARLYKTGDLVRYLANGNMDYLGRTDHQVKLRGFRIELGEIETLLSQHPGVREAVVLIRENISGNKYLVAYMIPNQEQALISSELRNFLKEQLPQYMVPSAFVTLDTLPLTPNGKVDRKALPNPESVRSELATAYVGPRTEMEQTIATVWQEVLGVEKLGMHDNFFDLGGHSLLMVQVHKKLQEIFKRDFLMTEMFKYPSISSLVEYLSSKPGEKTPHQQSQKRLEMRKKSMDRRKNVTLPKSIY
jgi:acyl carrier protein